MSPKGSDATTSTVSTSASSGSTSVTSTKPGRPNITPPSKPQIDTATAAKPQNPQATSSSTTISSAKPERPNITPQSLQGASSNSKPAITKNASTSAPGKTQTAKPKESQTAASQKYFNKGMTQPATGDATQSNKGNKKPETIGDVAQAITDIINAIANLSPSRGGVIPAMPGGPSNPGVTIIQTTTPGSGPGVDIGSDANPPVIQVKPGDQIASGGLIDTLSDWWNKGKEAKNIGERAGDFTGQLRIIQRGREATQNQIDNLGAKATDTIVDNRSRINEIPNSYTDDEVRKEYDPKTLPEKLTVLDSGRRPESNFPPDQAYNQSVEAMKQKHQQLKDDLKQADIAEKQVRQGGYQGAAGYLGEKAGEAIDNIPAVKVLKGAEELGNQLEKKDKK